MRELEKSAAVPASMRLAFCAVLVGCQAAPREPKIEATLAFVDVNVVPLDRERVIPAQTVLVRGDVIVAIGPAETTTVPSGARVVNGHGKYLLPGLVDMHAHLIRESDLDLYVARGVTTVRNMWGAPIHLQWRNRISKGERVGPNIFTAGPILDGDPPVHDGSLLLRTVEEADRAIALHRSAGYDFLKVYSNVPLPAFERLMTGAKAAGLSVAGHVPRAVGLERAIGEGQSSIEHLTAFPEALQANDSPVAGKFDRASRAKKIDHVDESKLPALAETIRKSGAWIVPTRVVMNQLESPEALKTRLARPEMKYVGGYDRAVWQTGIERSPARIDADRRELELGDKVIRALHAGKVKLLVGTDTGNPFVVPGFSVHEELERWVGDGLSAYEALRAATVGPAEWMGRSDGGTIAVGKRADLILVDGDPLVDVRAADRISAVCAHGRLLASGDLDALLAGVEAHVKDDREWGTPLSVEGKPLFSASFRIRWNGATFGGEEIVMSADRSIHARTFDPHNGQTTTMHWLSPGKMMIESEGAQGSGQLGITQSEGVHASGTLLSGIESTFDAKVAPQVVAAEGFLASRMLLSLDALAIGASTHVVQGEISLGSSIEMSTRTWTVTRLADGELARPGLAKIALRRFTFASGDRKAMLGLDGQSFPVEYEVEAFGSTVRFEREGF